MLRNYALQISASAREFHHVVETVGHLFNRDGLIGFYEHSHTGDAHAPPPVANGLSMSMTVERTSSSIAHANPTFS